LLNRLFFFLDVLLCLWISVHKEINHDFPFFITRDLTTELKDLTSEEPEDVSD
jgi:hypothetical protein